MIEAGGSGTVLARSRSRRRMTEMGDGARPNSGPAGGLLHEEEPFCLSRRKGAMMSTGVHVWMGIAVGGMVGALARYGVTAGLASLLGTSFPWGTLAVNLLGSYLLGLIGAWNEVSLAPSVVRTALGTGLVGAFTTFSTLQWELLVYLRHGQWKETLLYVGVSLGLGLLLIWLGLTTGQVVLVRASMRGDGP